jgi:2-oxo-3-hexenedioate decarboxylase
MREARGELPVGRKIGFTNPTVWTYAPMWGYVYNRTVHSLSEIGNTFPLAGLAEPRIEPEIVFRLAVAPTLGMDERTLLESIDWVAHGFEIVLSIFPGWKFSAPDAVAAFGLHGALLIGPPHRIERHAEEWNRTLSTFEIDLKRDGMVVDHGVATNVLATASSRRSSRARSGQSATRSWRDRHDGNADACTSGVRRRDMDDRTDGCRA